MKNFIKFYSLFIILLFFPISINICNSFSKNFSQIPQISDLILCIFPKGDGLYTKVIIATRYNVTNIDWKDINRNGKLFYLNIKIDFGKELYSIFEFKVNELEHSYRLGNIKDFDIGNYSLLLYINDYRYRTCNFTVNPSPIPIEAFKESVEIEENFFKVQHFWNGKEWIIKSSLFFNFIPEEIDWGEIKIIDERTRMANISLNGKWIKIENGMAIFLYEHNYSLGMLPKGDYLFVNILKNIENDPSFKYCAWFYYFDISEIYRKTIVETYIATTTYAITENGETKIKTTTYRDIRERTIYITISQYITTEIATLEEENKKIETIETTSIIETTTMPTTPTILTTEETTLETKTIQETSIIEETPEKEKFEFEKYSTIFFLLFIVIIATLLLYFILFKREKI